MDLTDLTIVDHVFVVIGSGGAIMYASTKLDTVPIIPASTPSALNFYATYRRGGLLTRDDAIEVAEASLEERADALPWIVTNVEIIGVPETSSRAHRRRSERELVVTLQSGPLKVEEIVWPPRLPSAVTFLKAFLAGRSLSLKEFLLARKFMKEELRQSGMSTARGVLDWHPAWEDYL